VPPELLGFLERPASLEISETTQSTLNYLDKPEMDALLPTPDRPTPAGRRDYALLLFLYNTGARVSGFND
jgi:integrase/recombinase XerD